ncbi:addiction module protein [Georgenia phoenicis]|uniref:addiction module protein n=1 Tax=unclassified Georgenia TaxID=2626815 RepID=UPI0039AF38CF
MTAELEAYIKAGLALDPDDRAVAAHRLLESLHQGQGTDDDVDAAWQGEIDRRVGDVLSGRTRLLDVEESRAKIRADLADRRS